MIKKETLLVVIHLSSEAEVLIKEYFNKSRLVMIFRA